MFVGFFSLITADTISEFPLLTCRTQLNLSYTSKLIVTSEVEASLCLSHQRYLVSNEVAIVFPYPLIGIPAPCSFDGMSLDQEP